MHSSAAFPIRFQALKIQYCRYHVSASTFCFSMNIFHLSSRHLAVSQLKPDTQRSFFLVTTLLPTLLVIYIHEMNIQAETETNTTVFSKISKRRK